MNANSFRKTRWSVVLATVVAVALGAAAAKTTFARGGGGHGGGGHAGGHAGGHGGENHPYHPTERHTTSHGNEHRADHHDNRHYDHHHHDWHYAGWGPGFWGGLGLGYMGGLGTGYYGGGYVDNSTCRENNTNDLTGDNATATTDNSANAGGDANDATQSAGNPKLPVDVWPELGISTYCGQYGKSQGLVVVRVMPHSPADRAGLVPGDVLLKFNGQPVPDDDTLEKLMGSAGGKFEVWVWDARTGRKSTLSGQLDTGSDGQGTTPTK